MLMKRIFIQKIVGTVLIASAIMLIVGGGRQDPDTHGSQFVQAAPMAWTFEGRVYEGEFPEEPPNSSPMQGVRVELYGANNPHPDPGVLLDTTTTNVEGWYGLTGPDTYEFYHIREIDPSGYISVGARSVDGTVRTDNWIEYVIPLGGKTLAGNKFWDRSGVPTPTHTPTPTLTPNPTLTPTPTATSTQAPTLDLQVDHVEIVQAIQCKDNPNCTDSSVPLIAGKTTYVRVYVKLVNAGSTSVANVSANVTAKFSGGAYSLGVPLNSSINAPLYPQRSQFNNTLNFWLDPWVVNKSGTLEVEVNPNHTIPESNYANNKTTVNLNYVSTPQLAVVPVRVHYSYGTKSGLVNWDMHFWMNNYLENILPVGDVKWYIPPGPPLSWTKQLSTQGNWGNVLAVLNALRVTNNILAVLSPGANFAPPTAHWYAMLPFKEVGGLAGLASTPGYVAMGRVPISYENLENAADIMAHELGHNFSRPHAPCGVPDPDPSYPYLNARLGDYGWDPQGAAGGKVQSLPGGWVVPAQSFDLMSYCQDEWISEYTYKAILNYRGSTPAIKTLKSVRKLPRWDSVRRSESELQPYLLASGTISGEGASLDPWTILQAPIGYDDGPGEGAFLIRLLTASEEILFERSFELEMAMPSWLPGQSSPTDDIFSFFEVLPWNANTEIIQLWQGGTLLAERAVSTSSPVVDIANPVGGTTWAADGEYLIEWIAEDQDSDSLWFDVAFSRDGGGSWQTFAARLEENSILVRGDQFPGTEAAMLRVFATDGVLTSEATSGVFSIEPKPPGALITLPLDASTVPPDMPVSFKGYAYDPEDGSLEGAALSWNSDQDGDLGAGNELLVDLSQGQHVITLAATDSADNTTTTTIRVFVGYRTYLPLLSRR